MQERSCISARADHHPVPPGVQPGHRRLAGGGASMFDFLGMPEGIENIELDHPARQQFPRAAELD
jgi:hypothetical protein